MKTQIKKRGDFIIVSMDGRLDFETTVPLKEDLSKLVDQAKKVSSEDFADKLNRTDSVPKKIIFNLEKLEFVGSSGISNFVQTMKEFNAISPTKPKYCNVKSEFKRIIQAFDNDSLFEIYENEDRAKKSFDQ